MIPLSFGLNTGPDFVMQVHAVPGKVGDVQIHQVGHGAAVDPLLGI